MTQPVSIAVIGSINLDIVASGAALPRPGETITGAQLAYHPGGKGANQALAGAKLGAKVTMVGCVGDDAAAGQALALLSSNKVDLSHVRVVETSPTGVALIAVNTEGENQIVVASGANERVSSADLAAMQTQAFDAIICQLEIPIETIEAIANNVTGFLAINLAPAVPVPQAVLRRADLIIVNQTEAAFYGDELKNLPGLVVVTLGGQGANMYQTNGDIFQATPPKVVPVDTTGAGDTFVGALVVALMEGQPHEQALRFACAAGAAATLKPGAQPAMPSRDEVEALMRSNL